MDGIISAVYNFLWGDWIAIPLPGGGHLPLSLLVLILIPTGVYFTIRTRFLPVRLFPHMIRSLFGKKGEKGSALSVLQTPVSYTHLDVYKRQSVHRAKSFIIISWFVLCKLIVTNVENKFKLFKNLISTFIETKFDNDSK